MAMTHDDYWKKVWTDAHTRLNRMLSECDCTVADIVGDDGGIDSFEDAKMVLSYALRCAECGSEKSCAILSVGEALHALHELNEHMA